MCEICAALISAEDVVMYGQCMHPKDHEKRSTHVADSDKNTFSMRYTLHACEACMRDAQRKWQLRMVLIQKHDVMRPDGLTVVASEVVVSYGEQDEGARREAEMMVQDLIMNIKDWRVRALLPDNTR